MSNFMRGSSIDKFFSFLNCQSQVKRKSILQIISFTSDRAFDTEIDSRPWKSAIVLLFSQDVSFFDFELDSCRNFVRCHAYENTRRERQSKNLKYEIREKCLDTIFFYVRGVGGSPPYPPNHKKTRLSRAFFRYSSPKNSSLFLQKDLGK